MELQLQSSQFFGKVARQIVGKPMVALIRSASKNQHGASGAELVLSLSICYLNWLL
jgi:hypothetical protein